MLIATGIDVQKAKHHCSQQAYVPASRRSARPDLKERIHPFTKWLAIVEALQDRYGSTAAFSWRSQTLSTFSALGRFEATSRVHQAMRAPSTLVLLGAIAGRLQDPDCNSMKYFSISQSFLNLYGRQARAISSKTMPYEKTSVLAVMRWPALSISGAIQPGVPLRECATL